MRTVLPDGAVIMQDENGIVVSAKDRDGNSVSVDTVTLNYETMRYGLAGIPPMHPDHPDYKAPELDPEVTP